MAKVLINRGSVANDGTGDNLRAGANKVNLNFDEIYTAIGDGTTLSANIKVKDDTSTLATINAKGDVLGILGGTGITSAVSGSNVSLSITGFSASSDIIPGKVEGTNFDDSLLVGHSTTGTLNNATDNTGIGIDTLKSLTSGDQNTAIGNAAGLAITSSSYNTAVGVSSLMNQTNNADGYNTAVGRSALQLATGSYNTGVGGGAGENITSGKGNVIIGKVLADSATADKQLKIAGYDGTTTTTWITGDSTGKVTIPGDLDVQGSQTVIDSATIQITNSFTFEGTTSDDKETILTVIDPTVDRTVSLPDATGTVVLKDTTDVLTNKTLTSPVLGGTTTTASGNIVIDPATQILEVKGDGSSVAGQLLLNCHANTHGQTLESQPHSEGVTNTMLLPKGANSTLVSLVSTDTLTNKTISGSTNSVTNLSAAALTSGTINLSSSGNKLRFNFAGTGALPNEATYEGMFAYDTTGNAPYVADAAGWTKIITENMSVSALSDVNISGIADSNSLVWSSAQGRFNAGAIPTAGFSIAMAVAL